MPNVALQAYSEPEREMNTLKDVCPTQRPLSVSGHFMMCLRDDDDARPCPAFWLLGEGKRSVPETNRAKQRAR